MRYRARVIPLYEGHRQEAEATWEYTDAISIAQAGRFLRIRYPYPKYVVEEPIPDFAKLKIVYYTITDPGKTVLHVDDVITEEALFDENERVIRRGEMPAIGKKEGQYDY